MSSKDQVVKALREAHLHLPIGSSVEVRVGEALRAHDTAPADLPNAPARVVVSASEERVWRAMYERRVFAGEDVQAILEDYGYAPPAPVDVGKLLDSIDTVHEDACDRFGGLYLEALDYFRTTLRAALLPKEPT